MKNPEGIIDDILERGVLVEFYPSKKEFKDALMSGKKLKFYIGADPTAKALHLGHAQNLMVLEQFRQLGHEAIFLIGDFTGMIGDPSDKSSARVKQTPAQVQENFSLWKEQVKNILDFDDVNNPVQIKYNSEWLGKLNFAEVLELASNFTVQQMLERDMFEKRMKAEKPIYIHEFMYPLMQGYDSVAMDVDVEMCGTDQIFNALAGRTLMQKLKNKDKFVVATKLIADEKSGLLMSKSNGTGVFLGMDANALFGAIMSQPDGMMRPLFLGCTKLTLKEINELDLEKNPRDAKIRLAYELVRIYHGEEEAEKAKDYFVRTISNKEMPSEIAEVKVDKKEIKLIEFIVSAGLAKSNGEARRKIEQGGVEIQEKRESDWQRILSKEDDGAVVKIGKFSFVKIKFTG